MDAVGIAIIICVVVGLVIAAVVGVIAFMAGSSHRKKSAEATIGSAEEEAMEYGLLSEFSLLNSRTEQTLYCSNSSEFIPYFSQYSNSFWVNLCSWKLYGLVFFSGRMGIVGFGIDWIGISVSSDSPSDKSRFMLFRISTKSMVLLQFNPFSLPTK